MRGIITYHSVDPSGSPVSIDEAAFQSHVAWLATGVVPVVSLHDLVRPGAPDSAVALTFDDAFRNFADVAWPLLRRHNLPVTLFAVSGHVGGRNDWGGKTSADIPTLPLMDWGALRRAAEEGVTIGAHSRTHPDLRGLDDASLADELAGSAVAIAEHTGVRPTSFAYPYGGVNDRVAATAGASFSLAVTTELRPLDNADDPLRLPRLDAFYLREPGQIESWGTPAFKRRVAFRGVLRKVRARVTGRPA